MNKLNFKTSFQDISVYHLQIHTPDQVWDFKTIKREKDKNDRKRCKRPSK